MCEFQQGNTITKEQTVFGDIPVVASGKIPPYYHNVYNRIGETIAVSGSGAYAGFVSYWTIPVFLSGSFSVKPNNNELSTKYVFYFLKSIQNKIHNKKKGAGVPHVYASDLANFQIPIPPLEVQKQIVAILDTFTELEAELEARKKQYAYYRDKLLSIENLSQYNGKTHQVAYKSLGEVGKISMCKRIFKNETKAQGDIPFYKIGTFGKNADCYIDRELFNEYKMKYSYPKKGEILISASGTIGRVVVYDGEEAYYQDSNIVWIENDESMLLNKFLFYFYKNIKWEKYYSKGGTIVRLYNDNIKKIQIPIPPLEVQKQIVAILDTFDALVNDLTSGLPAEIHARRMQYEYYRDRLLTFEGES